ncbi:hypothetical protein [Citreimonas salinaria]|uniref:Uncharacterized protein n=1 Tax=Citreimonas salinaria TaxID=321339 RepID=A0A1H3KRH6_9RHOB|nr:hypothetical protein [Citreimonas salinaria]SDY54606.1 hypothetical protein SAMN05444340_11057 [Citreimonas salinaria]
MADSEKPKTDAIANDDSHRSGSGGPRRVTLDLDNLAGRHGTETASRNVDPQVAKNISQSVEQARKAIAGLNTPRLDFAKYTEPLRKQQEIIDMMREADRARPNGHPHLDFKFPPNPAVETNERLERIEKRFEQFQELGTQAAETGVNLQTAAFEFLGKFESAAASNDRSAKIAIWVGLAAVVTAAIGASAPIIYAELTRPPDPLPALNARMEALQSELVGLRQDQDAAAQRLVEVIEEASDSPERAAVLREIRDILVAGQTPPETDEERRPTQDSDATVR